MMVPTGFVRQEQIAAEIQDAIRKLPADEVAHVAYSITPESTGDPAIYFRVLLTDAASSEENLGDVAGRVEATLFNTLHPLENWGLIPYFNFRSQSEQRKRYDPEWS